MKLTTLFPFLVWTRFITRQSIKDDFFAGLTGAVIVLPQGVAFAAIAGMPPEYGLYTAMVTPIVAALFGSSFHLVSGPTTAISIVVFAAISRYAEPGTPEFISLALTLTFIAGVYQLAFGLARLGALVNFVSHTVVIGFTAGAAILIATSQMQHVLGVDIPPGESFLHTWVDIGLSWRDIDPFLLSIAGVTLVTALLVRRFVPKIPNLLIAMMVGSLLAAGLAQFAPDIELVGEIPAHLPPFSVPEFSFATLRTLAPEAFAVALLGLIEAVSISRAVATRSNQRIDANQEFIGQGLSNAVGSMFSSYAGSGSLHPLGDQLRGRGSNAAVGDFRGIDFDADRTGGRAVHRLPAGGGDGRRNPAGGVEPDRLLPYPQYLELQPLGIGNSADHFFLDPVSRPRVRHLHRCIAVTGVLSRQNLDAERSDTFH
jgi:sulfate permease, SulP family